MGDGWTRAAARRGDGCGDLRHAGGGDPGPARRPVAEPHLPAHNQYSAFAVFGTIFSEKVEFFYANSLKMVPASPNERIVILTSRDVKRLRKL